MRGFGEKVQDGTEDMEHRLYQQLSYIGHFLYRLRCQSGDDFKDSFRGQGKVLSILLKHPEISQKELSGLLDMRQQSLGELLAKLEKAGYICRTRSEKDRRAFDIQLTETGIEAAKKSLIQEKRSIPQVADCLTDEEKKEFSLYLDRIITNLGEKYGDELKKDEEKRARAHRKHHSHME